MSDFNNVPDSISIRKAKKYLLYATRIDSCYPCYYMHCFCGMGDRNVAYHNCYDTIQQYWIEYRENIARPFLGEVD